MKKLNLVRAMFVMMAMFPATSSVFAQGDKNPIQKPRATAKSAVVVVMREDKLQFVTEKSRLMGYVQKALAKTNRGEVVKNIDIRTFEKGSFFAVQIEKSGTVFLELVPVGGGIQGKFSFGYGEVYCASSTCKCDMSWAGGTPKCSCASDMPQEIPGATGECHVAPKIKYEKLAANISLTLLADGFGEPEGPGAIKNVDVKVPSKKTPREK